ncbi:MAG TPA: hypothetical protein VEC35_24380 [Noviherbaspirillum sp.]|nr:hypothetical protein [Noviherbaspirillum sp.]
MEPIHRPFIAHTPFTLGGGNSPQIPIANASHSSPNGPTESALPGRSPGDATAQARILGTWVHVTAPQPNVHEQERDELFGKLQALIKRGSLQLLGEAARDEVRGSARRHCIALENGGRKELPAAIEAANQFMKQMELNLTRAFLMSAIQAALTPDMRRFLGEAEVNEAYEHGINLQRSEGDGLANAMLAAGTFISGPRRSINDALLGKVDRPIAPTGNEIAELSREQNAERVALGGEDTSPLGYIKQYAADVMAEMDRLDSLEDAEPVAPELDRDAEKSLELCAARHQAEKFLLCVKQWREAIAAQ